MKFFATIALLIGMAALLPAQALTVTSPRNGDVWILGSTQLITWETNGYTGHVAIEIGRMDAGFVQGGTITSTPYPLASDRQYSWKVGEMRDGDPLVIGGTYHIDVINLDEGIWCHSGTFTIGGLNLDLKHIRFIEYRWPPLPDPCRCPQFDLRQMRDVLGLLRFPVSLALLKNGQQIQQLGSFAKGSMLPVSLKAQLSKVDFDMLKSGRAKFTLAVLGARGKILSEHGLQLQRQIKLMQR